MHLFILLLIFGTISVFCWVAFPPIFEKASVWNQKRSRMLDSKMDRMFIRARSSRLQAVYPVLFFGCALSGFFLFPAEFKILGLISGAVLGLFIPNVYVRTISERRMSKFNDQLIDVLMVLSSSLRGGLSLIKAIEVVVEEMPEPVNQEFGILLGENKMGVSLEESFAHLYERMPSTALHQMITAILLARETGGNLPLIFTRIVNAIREDKKIKQNVDNLTLQGKIQGIVMSLLPIGFAAIVMTTNKNFFQQMLNTDIGRNLLTYAAISECIGAFLIWHISRFRDF